MLGMVMSVSFIVAPMAVLLAVWGLLGGASEKAPEKVPNWGRISAYHLGRSWTQKRARTASVLYILDCLGLPVEVLAKLGITSAPGYPLSLAGFGVMFVYCSLRQSLLRPGAAYQLRWTCKTGVLQVAQLVGEEGFEPSPDGTRIRCPTVRPLPKGRSSLRGLFGREARTDPARL